MTTVLRRAALGLLLLSGIGSAHAQSCLSLASTDVAVTESFDTLANSGSSATLPAGWALRETGTNANGLYTAGTGSSNTGDSFSFGASGSSERALGGLRSGSLVPGFGACLRNDTGGDITALDVAYVGEQWRMGTAGRVDRLDVQVSYDATSLADGTWSTLTELAFVAPSNAGTVGLRDGNAAANRTALSTTIGSLAVPEGATVWLRWVDTDASGADDGLAIDDVSVIARGAGVSPPRLSVADAAIDEGDAGSSPLFFTFSLNKPAAAGGVVVDYASADGTAGAGSDFVAVAGQATIAEGQTSVTISVDVLGDTAVEGDEAFFVNVVAATGATVADGQAAATIRTDDFVLTAIHQIQGSGSRSPIEGQFVTTTGIVTGRKNNGFFLQAPDAEADADPLTSDGVFVFTGGAPSAAATVGNRVRVRGTVLEFVPPAAPAQRPLTQLGGSPTVTALSSGNPMPAPIPLTADMTTADGGLEQLEFAEGMRVTVASVTVVAPTLGSSPDPKTTGTVNGILTAVITGVARPFREPGVSVFDAIPGGASSPPIPVWDANPEAITIDSDTLGGPAFVLDLPAGSVIEGLTGPLDYGFLRYTVHRDPAVPINVAFVPQIRAARVPTADEFTVASYNLERFFDTVNDPAIGEPVLSAAQFDLRLRKASLGIRDYLHAPDVLVTIEVENLATLQALAARINADAVAAGQPDPQYVAYLEEGNDVGGIDTGMLVKTAATAGGAPRVEVLAVTQVGKDATWTQPNGSPDTLNDRPPLVLDAVVRFDDGRAYPVTVVGVHQRSLIDVEADTATGERVRLKRLRQAEFLAQYLQQRQAASADTRLVVLGDFNAFGFNDGLVDSMNVVTGTPTPDAQTVVAGDGIDYVDPDLVNLDQTLPPEERYSFMFDGNAQTLDHVLVNEEAVVTTRRLALDHARINADFTDTSRANAAVPTRTADHDPVIAYFDPRPRADLAVTATAGPATRINLPATFTATVRNNGPDAAEAIGVGFALDGELPTMAVVAPAGWSCDAAQVDAGRTTVACLTATLANGAEAAFSISATTTQAQANAPLTLAVAVEAQSLDEVPANDEAVASVAVVAEADLAVALGGPDKKLHYDRVEPFALLFTHRGPDAAWQPVVTLAGDAPAANVAIAPVAGWTCEVAGDAARFVATCRTAGAFAAGASQRFDVAIRVPARPDSTGFLTLQATAASATPELVPADNTASYRNRIVGVP
ncbi:Calx-beta domain-containing protein [Cognatilysobacter tabacisoli]|uniref:Calx-beta domain-containing protein n=1 Tax=Cognatilysobacter tabacisoli TaxID=2315424 RepID=UPI001E466D12|nr:Calx-beta domain-containing protein [Lysobacter tabacisoli]